MTADVQLAAIQMLGSIVDVSVSIPQRVFPADFRDVFVMDFAWLVDRRTVDLMKMLMTSEHADVVVISKLSELDEQSITLGEDIFTLDKSTSDESYASLLTRNWTEAAQKSFPKDIKRPWSVFAKTIAACSERGSWCIYGDKYAEIALLGFRRKANAFLTKRLEAEFKCVRLVHAFANNWLGLGKPVNEHHKQFCKTLRQSYAEEWRPT